MTSQFANMTSSLFFFRMPWFFLNFSYWLKFHVNIITGSRVTTIFLHKGLTRNPRNTPVWVLPNVWRLGQVRDTKFGTNVSNVMLPNAAKCQGYSFYRFWVIKGKLIGSKITPYAFHFMEFSLHFVYIFKTEGKLLTKFASLDSSFSRSTLTLLYLKFETSVHAQIAVIH